jgi:hypothetical protein
MFIFDNNQFLALSVGSRFGLGCLVPPSMTVAIAKLVALGVPAFGASMAKDHAGESVPFPSFS